MGLQDYYHVSAFSQFSALAMTWNKGAIYAQAKAVATEFYLKDIQVVDGPNIPASGPHCVAWPTGRDFWTRYIPERRCNGIERKVLLLTPR